MTTMSSALTDWSAPNWSSEGQGQLVKMVNSTLNFAVEVGAHVQDSSDYNLSSLGDLASQMNESLMEPRAPPMYSASCAYFDFIVEAVLMGIMCFLGFTGNSLSIVCLSKDKSKTATPFLLVSLELADTVFLVTVLLLRVFSSLHQFTGWFESFFLACLAYLGTLVWPCAMIAEMGTIYLTLLVTVNRYISVCRPYEASNLCSVYHARRHVILVTLFSIAYNIPRFFEYNVVPFHDERTNFTFNRAQLSEMGRNKVYQIVYGNAMYFLVYFLIPLITLIILNFKLIKALQATKKKRAQLISNYSSESNSKSEDDITLILIVVVVVFVICQAPALVTQSLSSFLDQSQKQCSSAFFYYERFSDLMIVANSSMNFIIYCFCSRKFRQILKSIICHKEHGSPEVSQNHTHITKVPKHTKIVKNSQNDTVV